MNFDFIDFNFLWNFELVFTWRSVLGIAVVAGLFVHWLYKRNKRKEGNSGNDVKVVSTFEEWDYEQSND